MNGSLLHLHGITRCSIIVMQGSKPFFFGLCLTKFYICSSRCSPGIQTCTPTLVGVGTNSVRDGNAHSGFYLCWSWNSWKTSDITSNKGDFPAASTFESSKVDSIGIVGVVLVRACYRVQEQ
jgi:hypothetical protein